MLKSTSTDEFKSWLKTLHQTNLLRVVGDLLLIYSIMFGAIIWSTKSDSWIVYILSVLIIGSRQHALGSLVHDGTHYTLSKNRYVNDLICDLFCAFPIFISSRGFRTFHIQHHRYTRTEKDPEVMAINQDPAYRWPKTKFKTASLLLRDITGINFHSILGILFIWSDALSFLRVPKAKWMKLGMNEDFAGWLDRTDPKFQLSIGIKLRVISFYGAVAIALTYFGIWKLFFLYWMVPIFTVLAFIIRVRGMSEHNGLAFEHELNSSRTTIDKNIMVRLFMSPLKVNYHLEHHLYPQVPYFHLKTLHHKLAQNPEYLTCGGLSYSYYKNVKNLTV